MPSAYSPAAASWHTVLTSMFMHGGWMHLIGNMWFLWIFGNNVEDAMGHLRFVVFYLLCGIAAAALQIGLRSGLHHPDGRRLRRDRRRDGRLRAACIRTCTCTCCVLGFYATTIAVPAYFMLGYWFLLQLVSGSVALGAQGGGVAFWAHVGGFVAGALLSLVFRNRELLARHPFHGWKQQAAPTQNWHKACGAEERRPTRRSGSAPASARSALSAPPPERVVSTSCDFDDSVFASRLNSCIRKSSLRPTASPEASVAVNSVT